VRYDEEYKSVTIREIKPMVLPTKRVLTVVVLLLLACQLFMVPFVHAESEVYEEGAELGAFFANMFYTPAKMTYAMLGGVAGSIAYVLTGADGIAACRIWTVSIRGTYALTPAHLNGEKTVHFAGVSPQTEEDLKRELDELRNELQGP